MTSTATEPSGEGPRFMTTADAEALEGRLINRLADMELRLTKQISGAFWRQLLWLGGIILVLGIAIINLGVTILGRLPVPPMPGGG